MKTAGYMRKAAALLLAAAMLLTLAFPVSATGTLISSDPVGGSCSAGGTAPTLTVSAAPKSGGTLSYQWYTASGAPVSGATGASFTPDSSAAGDFGYYVVVTEILDGAVVATDTSASATVSVSRDAETPKITANPSSASCTVGQTVTLYAKAEVSSGTLSYRWYCYTSESAVGGATEIYTASSPSYTPPTDRASSVYYYCRITNTDTSATGKTKTSVNTSTALVTVRNTGDAEPPVIYSQPENLVCYLGENAEISVGATVSDGGSISYQWYGCDDADGNGAEKIEGAENAYFRPDTSAETETYVFCVLTNTNDSVTGNKTAETKSEIVRLEIREPDIAGTVWDGESSGRFDSGTGSRSDPYVIKTGGQLAFLAELSGRGENFENTYFVLGEDIILGDGTVSCEWTPVGDAENPFNGVFDGCGRSITGLSVTGAGCTGLFGWVKNAEIRNIQAEGSVSGTAAGGIAGAAEYSVIENCMFEGSVAGTKASGGIVGTVCGGAVSNCLSLSGRVAGEKAGFALTDSSFDTGDGLTVLSRCARVKAGLALWSMDLNGDPCLTDGISDGTGEDITGGGLSPQTGISGTNAIVQTSVRGVSGEKTASMWVDPAEFARLAAIAAELLAENENASPYVYLDGGDIVSSESGLSAELVITGEETALLANAGAVWEAIPENGVPVWREKVKGRAAAMTVDFGEINATWSAETLGKAEGAGRIAAGFNRNESGSLSSVDIAGYTGGTWRVAADGFSGRSTVAAVLLTSGGHTKYSVSVNGEGFAEFASRGLSATFIFFDENSVPEEYMEDIRGEDNPDAPAEDPNGSAGEKPAPKPGSTLIVAACAVIVSVGGAFLYALLESAGGKRKKNVSEIKESRFGRY